MHVRRTTKDDRSAKALAAAAAPHQSSNQFAPDEPARLHCCRKELQSTVNEDINVLALVKGRERYIFLYEDSQRAEALRVLGRFASNPELSFTWYDAAVLSQKVRASAPAEAPETSEVMRRMNLPQAE